MAARILLIEENWEILELMRFLLKARGHAPLSAPDAATGIAMAHRDVPDLVLCDLSMPDMEGEEILRRIRERATLADVPVVALGPDSMAHEDARLRAAGFAGRIAKPITPDNFAGEVARHLPARLRPRPAAAPPATRQSAKSILVVDDLQSNLELAEIVLQHLGYEVLLAQGKREALRTLRNARPDLIMSDVLMEDGDGYDLLREVSSDPVLQSIPFILITSFALDESQRARGLDMGADRYLTRPIAPNELRHEIEACVRERLAEYGAGQS